MTLTQIVNNIYYLFKQEWLVQNKIHHINRYSFLFFTFSLITSAVIYDPTQVEKLGPIFSVIYIPLAILGLCPVIFKPDIEDGTFDLLASTVAIDSIVIAKFVSLVINNIVSFICAAPLIAIFFNLAPSKLILIINIALILILLASALIILIAAIQIYFQGNTNFLVTLMMPLLIPSIILSGLLIQNFAASYFLYILIGIDLILIPVILYCTSYLLKHLYHY